MKKVINEYRIFIIGGLLVVIFLTLLLWPQNKKNDLQNQPEQKQVEIVGFPRKAESVDWSQTTINVPEKTTIIKSKNNPLSVKQINLIKSIVGMNGVGITKSTDSYEVFENDKATLYIFINEKEIDYQIKYNFISESKKDPTKAQNNFNELLVKLSLSDKMTKPIINYYKDEFRAINSTVDLADFLEITTTPTKKGIPLLNYKGENQIKAQYNFDGVLGRLIIYNVFDEMTDDKVMPLMSANEIKVTSAANMPIFDEIGGREFQMSTGDEEIKTINAGKGQLVYIFRKSDHTYQPYYLNQGQTTLTTGITKIIFGVPLAK